MPQFRFVASQSVVDNLGQFGRHSCARRVFTSAIVRLRLLLAMRWWRRRDDQDLVDVVVVQFEIRLFVFAARGANTAVW